MHPQYYSAILALTLIKTDYEKLCTNLFPRYAVTFQIPIQH